MLGVSDSGLRTSGCWGIGVQGVRQGNILLEIVKACQHLSGR